MKTTDEALFCLSFQLFRNENDTHLESALNEKCRIKVTGIIEDIECVSPQILVR